VLSSYTCVATPTPATIQLRITLLLRLLALRTACWLTPLIVLLAIPSRRISFPYTTAMTSRHAQATWFREESGPNTR